MAHNSGASVTMGRTHVQHFAPWKVRRRPHPDQARVFRETRLAQGITAQRLAELLGVTVRHVKRLQAGTVLPSELVAERFLQVTGIRLPLPEIPFLETRTGQRMTRLAREGLQLPREQILNLSRQEFKEVIRKERRRRVEIRRQLGDLERKERQAQQLRRSLTPFYARRFGYR